MGEAYRSKEDYNHALKSFYKAVPKAYAEDRLDMAYSYNNIPLVHQETEEYFQGLDYYEKPLEIKRKHLPPTYPSISTVHNNLGLIHCFLRCDDPALDHYKESLDIHLESLPSQHLDIAMSYENMGHVYEDKSDWEQALTYFNNVYTIYRKILAPRHPDTVKNKEYIRRVSLKLRSCFYFLESKLSCAGTNKS